MTQANAAPGTPDESILLTNFMPNRTRARLWRFVARALIGIAVLFAIQLLSAINTELYVRRHWPIAKAQVINVQDKSDDERHVVPGSSSVRTVYWIEFQVEFAVPVEQCKTGVSSGVLTQFLCIGSIHTLPRRSWAEAQDSLRKHPLNFATQVRYDPTGPHIKFADESIWDVYRWQNFVACLVILTLGLVLLRSAQQRLHYLETLPEEYDASPPTSPDRRDPNEIIDLKLS